MGDFDIKVINAEEEIQHIVDEIKKYFVKNGNENTKAVIGISGVRIPPLRPPCLSELLVPNE